MSTLRYRRSSDGAWTLLTLPAGPTGPTGATGNTGPTGPTGPDGTPGDTWRLAWGSYQLTVPNGTYATSPAQNLGYTFTSCNIVVTAAYSNIGEGGTQVSLHAYTTTTLTLGAYNNSGASVNIWIHWVAWGDTA